jgi:hypothetical protein
MICTSKQHTCGSLSYIWALQAPEAQKQLPVWGGYQPGARVRQLHVLRGVYLLCMPKVPGASAVQAITMRAKLLSHSGLQQQI